MDYKSYSNFLFAGALLILAAFLAYFIYNGGEWYLAIIPLLILVIAFLVFKTPLDRWGFRFQDPMLDDQLMRAAEFEYPVVANYSAEQKLEFRRRMFQFLFDRESYLVMGESEKLDLYNTMLLSIPAVVIGMGKSYDNCDDVERLAAYMHPFPSPKMKFLHAAEYDEEDGVVIMSLEQMMMGLRQSDQNYHIAYHVWSERYINHNEDFPLVPSEFKDHVKKIFGFGHDRIEGTLGYPNPSLQALALTAFYSRNVALQTAFPILHKDIAQHLGLTA